MTAAKRANATASEEPPVASPSPSRTPVASSAAETPAMPPRRKASRTGGTARNGSVAIPMIGRAMNAEKSIVERKPARRISRTPERGSGGRGVTCSPGRSVAMVRRNSGLGTGDSERPVESRVTNPESRLLVGGVRDQRDGPGALDRGLELALVERAGPRDPARQDLAALRDEGLQQLDVLPVHVLELLRAELADLAAPDEELLARGRLSVAVARGAPAAGARRHSPHDSLLSASAPIAAASSAGAGAAATACGGRGGRLACFLRIRSAILTERFCSSSARTARCRRTWSESFSRRSVSATSAGSAETWK